jgi:hypothetical protein
MRVLIACEVSGIVRNAFAQLGHDAWSCDLLPSERAGQHIQHSVGIVLRQGWDLMIAHPPCTHLAVSGARWFKGKEREQIEALDFVETLMSAPIPRICIENPISIINTRIRKPDQIIQPWQFGHDASKTTCLWLKNLPPLTPTKFIEPRMVCCGEIIKNGDKYGCPNCNGEKIARPRWDNQCNSGQNRLGPSPSRAMNRARTYEGIANAMADQWGGPGRRIASTGA